MLSLNKLRINLTLMNTAVLIGLAVFITVLLYVTISMDIESGVNNNLEIYCSQLANTIEVMDTQADSGGVTEEAKSGYTEFTKSLADNGIAYIIWDDSFNLIDVSAEQLLDQDKLFQLVARYFNEKRDKYLINDYETDTTSLKICTYATVNRKGELKVIQAVKNMDTERQVLGNAVRMLLIVVLVGGTVSVLCGYFLSGKSLVPIKKSMEQQEEFLADASHELRTPIAVIQTNLEVVKASPQETVESQKTWLDNAYTETRRMHQIVEDLMFLARADAGEEHAEMASVDLTYLIMQLTERFMPLAAQKNIVLKSDLEAEELLVDGDEKKLTQLLVILMDNAIKYSDAGSSVTLRGKRKLEGIEICVEDTGIGIAKEDQEKIFGRFYRVDKVRSRAEGGTGLGLSIALWIVKRHRGTLRVQSEEGVGTSMIMVFPPEDTKIKESEK